MTQVAIREYDAKHLVTAALRLDYRWHLICAPDDCALLHADTKRVIKPDQLFGKRGKLGLVGVNLSPDKVKERVSKHMHMQTTIGGLTGTLDTFLAEPFIAHDTERYVSIKTAKGYDECLLSAKGGMDIEEQWEFVRRLDIPLSAHDCTGLITDWLSTLPEVQALPPEYQQKLCTFLTDLYTVFVERGFVSLEINPFVFDAAGQIHLLDMVAKVDTCEEQQQWQHRSAIKRVKPFGNTTYPAEEHIAEVDSKTGASLKLTVINPQGKIWLLLGGGGASVITLDTLANQWLLGETANYGELSWNPDAESNKAYVHELCTMMFQNTAPKQYLCMIGGIANFTRIDRLCKPLAECIEQHHQAFLDKDIHILVRRWWLNDQEWLAMIQQVCEKYRIPHAIYDGRTYLTEVFKEIML